MNTKKRLGGVATAMLLAAASGQASACLNNCGVKLNGPVLQGPVLQGPILQGPVLNGPILQGPMLQGIQMNGALLQGPSIDGMQMDRPYGQGRGVFAMNDAQSLHAVPGHSAVSGIATTNVRVRLAR